MAITSPKLKIDLPMDEIAAFCRRWQIAELAVFGSALRDDFRPDSDIDFLVTFAPNAHRTLFDLVEMEEELGSMLGREVDLVERPGIERSHNWIRRQEILGTANPIYRAFGNVPSETASLSGSECRPGAQTQTVASPFEAERRRVTRIRSCLIDTITFSEQVIGFTSGMTYEQFVADSKTHFAVLHLFTLLGEAVRKLPAEVRDAHPELPWKKIIGMRNIIVHNYTDVDLHTVWETASDDLPEFLEAVRRLYDADPPIANAEPSE